MPLLISPGGCGCGCAGYKFCLLACGGTPAGATVAVLSGTTTIFSCTTGSDGCCSGNPPNGSYTVTATYDGVKIYSLPITLSGARTVTMSASPSSNNYFCCSNYTVPGTLTLTDASGSYPFTNTGSGWVCNTYPSGTGWLLNPGPCTFSGPSAGTIWVQYTMTCQGSAPWFLLTRKWACISNDGQVTFQYGLATPTTGFGGCGAGISCAPSFTVPCATSTDRQNPSSSSPLTLSFNPSATVGNKTADPVGGTVAISS